MNTSRIVAPLAVLAALLLPPAFAQDQDNGATLAQKAGVAYAAKDFKTAAALYAQAAENGPSKITPLYNAACSYALAGDADAAFRALQASIDAGLGGNSPAADPDFASLHADPRWGPMITRFEQAHPELVALSVLRDKTASLTRRYVAGRQAIAAGARLDDTTSMFNQFYANQAQFVGQYDEASRVYGWPRNVDDVVAAGFVHAIDAMRVVLAQARGRRAVFLNESHGQSQTRAANFVLLAGLRAEGFNTLAMETLASNTPTVRDSSLCTATSLGDAGLQARGYALDGTGYYSRDPVYAETIREALRLGFRLVAYDNSVEGGVPGREQNQAENLACVFKDDPKARLVVIAGFSHIAEGKDFWVPGGAMAYRFRELTGIDPLTVDTTTQLYLPQSALSVPAAAQKPGAVSFVLQDAKGKPYGTDNFDLVLYVPAPAHRDDGTASWLTLAGARKPTPVRVPECRDQATCFVSARRIGEVAEAVPADACVLAPSATGCTLYLAPGRYEILAWDESEKLLARRPLVLP